MPVNAPASLGANRFYLTMVLLNSLALMGLGLWLCATSSTGIEELFIAHPSYVLANILFPLISAGISLALMGGNRLTRMRGFPAVAVLGFPVIHMAYAWLDQNLLAGAFAGLVLMSLWMAFRDGVRSGQPSL
ncbi:MAG: hypothetical protein EP312_01090 [Gammaproteobacteria bacterium]|nr:MAG: hypothetical protein EP312_01090 [Gammaproteobacteria bacterium]